MFSTIFRILFAFHDSSMNERRKGLIGTICFHGFLFLCVFLMSFAGGGGADGDDGTGQALGGIEVSLGEPDLGGNDAEAGYSPEEEIPIPEKAADNQTLTDDNSEAPEIESKKPDVKPTKPVVPQITPPVFKKTTPNPEPKKMPDSKGLFSKKGGNKGAGTTPGVGGSEDGSINGNNGDGNSKGDGDGKPGHGKGDGDGDGDGPGKEPGPPGPAGKGKVDFGVKGYIAKSNWNFNPSKSGYGKVIIELCLNQNGSIKSVKHVLGGTMTDKYFIDLAIKAVRGNTYSPTGSTSSETCGKVTFNIKAQ